MEKVKLAIVIPTFNRVEKLKLALSRIESQKFDSRVDLHCVISNTASKDETSNFLEKLESTDKVTYHILNKQLNNININWLRCVEFIPQDIDWVWFHGDDDYLYVDDAIQIVTNNILNEENKFVTLIHACQARRSRRTGAIYKGTLLNLCNSLGYHEMLGWMSSLIVRRDKFVTTMIRHLKVSEKVRNVDDIFDLKFSAYPHSAALLESCIEDQALFIDVALVEPQDDAQTEESIQRWTNERMGDRYFFVIDDLIKLKNKKILKDNLTPVFFRYLNYSLWDRFSADIISSVINNNVLTDRDKDNLNRIKQIAGFFENPFDKKIFLQKCKYLEDVMLSYDISVKVLRSQRDQLINHLALINTACYPFEVLNTDGSLLKSSNI